MSRRRMTERYRETERLLASSLIVAEFEEWKPGLPKQNKCAACGKEVLVFTATTDSIDPCMCKPETERFVRWNVGKRMYDIIEGRIVATVREKPDK